MSWLFAIYIIILTIKKTKENSMSNIHLTRDVLKDFLHFKTGRKLYDSSTKLWWNGPSYLAELYMEELARKK